jgi:hypothetical protein
MTNLLEIEEDKFTSEQKAYIRKYAAGLLLAWVGPAIANHISPDTMDGFEPPAGVFPEDGDETSDTDLKYEGANEVGNLLDNFLSELAEIVGYGDLGFVDLINLVQDNEVAYTKYPLMKER